MAQMPGLMLHATVVFISGNINLTISWRNRYIHESMSLQIYCVVFMQHAVPNRITHVRRRMETEVKA
ncbi:MAG: hypothetical protein U9Q07_15335, partial [Planctomycetota bacterium]|nr:hypothetical protein [Planctomycetota bacterium]